MLRQELEMEDTATGLGDTEFGSLISEEGRKVVSDEETWQCDERFTV